MTRNQSPAAPEEVHRALLSGLLSHVGVRDEGRREYLGARGTRFAPWPGSGAGARGRRRGSWRPSSWRRRGSGAGRWPRSTPAGSSRSRSTSSAAAWSEPRWDRRRAEVVATERVTLYGLPVVPGARAPTAASIRACRASSSCATRSSRTSGTPRTASARPTATPRARVEALEDRARRHDLFAGDEAVLAFFAARVPADVASGRDFDRWWRDARRADPDLLTLTDDDLLVRGAADALDPRSRPDAWRQGDLVLPLSYRFAPGEADDGVTVHVPLGRARPAAPGRLRLARPRLPRGARHRAAARPAQGPAPRARADPRDRGRARGGRHAAQRPARRRPGRGARPPARRPRPARRVAPRGAPAAPAHDLPGAGRRRRRPGPRRRPRGAARARCARACRRAWPTPPPRSSATGCGPSRRAGSRATIALPGTEPAPCARTRPSSTRATPSASRCSSRRPRRTPPWRSARGACSASCSPPPPGPPQAGLTTAQRLTLAGAAARAGDPGAIVDDAVAAALDLLVARAGGPAWDEAGFARLQAAVGARLEPTAIDVLRRVAAVLDAAREVERRLEERRPPRSAPPTTTSPPSSTGSSTPGFAAAAGAARLPDLERWLRAAAHRLDRLPGRARARPRAPGRPRRARGRLRGRAWRRCPRAPRSRRRCGRRAGCSRSSARAGRRRPSGSGGRWRRPARDADRSGLVTPPGRGRAARSRRRRRPDARPLRAPVGCAARR